MARITTIQVWDAARVSAISVNGSTDIGPQVASTRIHERLQEPASLRMVLLQGCPAAMQVDANGALLRARRIVRLNYADGTFREFRIQSFTLDYDGSGQPGAEARDIRADLASSTPRRTLSSGFVDYTVYLSGLTAQAALDALISSDLDAPTLFEAGTVDAAYADEIVELFGDGTASHMDLLVQMCDQLGAEFEIVYNSGTGKYTVNVVEEAGWSAAEKTAGTADPSLRPIEVGPNSEGNRMRLRRRSEAQSYFSRIVPLSGTDQETVTIGRAFWNVSSATYDGVATRTTLVLDGDPVWADDALEGLYFGVSGSFFSVESTTAPGTVVVDGDATALTRGRFALTSAGKELTYLDAVSAEDTVESRVRFSNVLPFENLVAEAGLSADFSTWAAGMPAGWSKIGAGTATQVTDKLYVKHGTASLQYACDAGDGVVSDAITLATSDEHPYHSLFLHVRVTSGKVKVEVVDSGGTVHPTGTTADTTEDRLVALTIEGMDPVAGAATIRVVALEAGTTFYLDAITLTNSHGAYEYAPEMGPRALWREAARVLTSQGGRQPDLFDGAAYDVSHWNGAYAPIEVGSHVSVSDQYDAASSTYKVSFTSRVVEMVAGHDRTNGAIFKEVRLSRLPRDFRDRFRQAQSRPVLPRVPDTPPPSKPAIRPETFERDNGDGTRSAVMRLYVAGNTAYIDDVEKRTAPGNNIPEGTAWTGGVVKSTGGGKAWYEITEQLVPVHPTTIQARVRLASPFDAEEEWPAYSESYDFDTKPEPKVTHEWVYAGSAQYHLDVIVQKDTDSAAYEWEIQNSGTPVASGDSELTSTVARFRALSGVPDGATRRIRVRGWSGWNAGTSEVDGISGDWIEYDATAPSIGDDLLNSIDGSLIDPGSIPEAAMAADVGIAPRYASAPNHVGGPPFYFNTSDGGYYRNTGSGWDLVRTRVDAAHVNAATLAAIAANIGEAYVNDVLQVSSTGVILAGNTTDGVAMGYMTTSGGQGIQGIAGFDGGQIQFQIDATGANAGRIVAGGGNVVLGIDGLDIALTAGYAASRAVRWGNARIYGYDGGGGYAWLVIQPINNDGTDGSTSIYGEVINLFGDVSVSGSLDVGGATVATRSWSIDQFAPIVHDHDGDYAPIIHNHDDRYSLLGHNHDGTYHPLVNTNINGDYTNVYFLSLTDGVVTDIS